VTGIPPQLRPIHRSQWFSSFYFLGLLTALAVLFLDYSQLGFSLIIQIPFPPWGRSFFFLVLLVFPFFSKRNFAEVLPGSS
jgi:hypothetical protein